MSGSSLINTVGSVGTRVALVALAAASRNGGTVKAAVKGMMQRPNEMFAHSALASRDFLKNVMKATRNVAPIAVA